MPALLLSHHRTGSTAIRQALEPRLRLYADEPLQSRLAYGSVDWDVFFHAFREYELIHCHRQHVDELDGWKAFAKHATRIVHLTRQNRLHQALSYRRALQERTWQGHPRGHSHGDEISLANLTWQLLEWAELEAKAEFHFRHLPALRISYEEFADRPAETIERIVSFLLKPDA